MEDASHEWRREVMAYRAPFLERKLLQERIVSSVDEAQRLFAEVKRFLVLCDSDPQRSYSIPSRRVDEIWHQFVLFTTEYTAFCARFFGAYMHHAPSNAPVPACAGPVTRRAATDEEFAAAYEALFGAPPDDTWRDDLAVTCDRRLAIDPDMEAGLHVRVVDEKAELVYAPGEQEPWVCVRTDAWGAPALEFILRARSFFVRELPAPLADGEKIDLCRALVVEKILYVAR